MTLILAVTCAGYAVLVADRRLTSNGIPVDDEQDKIVTIAGNNGRGVVSFTGLAIAGGINVHDWLVDAVYEGLKGHGDFGTMIEGLRRRAESLYASLPPKAQKLPLSLIGVGVTYVTEPPRPMFFVITNDRTQRIVDWSQFAEARFGLTVGVNESPRWQDAFMLAYGWTGAVSDQELVAIQDLARAGKPPEAVRDKAIELVQAASGRKTAEGTIGGQCGSAIVRVDPSMPIEASYSVAKASNISYLVAHVAPGAAFKGGWVRADDGGPMVFPRVARNAPCPCGSKIRYRHCHGRSMPRARTVP